MTNKKLDVKNERALRHKIQDLEAKISILEVMVLRNQNLGLTVWEESAFPRYSLNENVIVRFKKEMFSALITQTTEPELTFCTITNKYLAAPSLYNIRLINSEIDGKTEFNNIKESRIIGVLR